MGERSQADMLCELGLMYATGRDCQADPVAAWSALRAFQAGLIGRLSRADVVRIEAEGTDLTLRVKDRTWVNSDGRRNMPSAGFISRRPKATERM